MQAVWPLVPLAANHGVGLAVFSYDGELYFCLNADRDSVPDLDVLATGIRRSIDELRSLASGGNGADSGRRGSWRLAARRKAPASGPDR
jgi:hypothetical protein